MFRLTLQWQLMEIKQTTNEQITTTKHSLTVLSLDPLTRKSPLRSIAQTGPSWLINILQKQIQQLSVFSALHGGGFHGVNATRFQHGQARSSTRHIHLHPWARELVGKQYCASQLQAHPIPRAGTEHILHYGMLKFYRWWPHLKFYDLWNWSLM